MQKRKGKAGNKKPLASRPKNVSNELTDHIPTHKSQTQNHIQTYNSTRGKRGIAVERLSGRRRPCLTAQWASSVYITWRNPTNGSEIVPCCQKFLLKGKKERERVGERHKGGKREREKTGRSCGRGLEGEGREHKAMCFTAYLGLGHYEYRREIKQIRSGMTRAAERAWLQWKYMGLWFTHRSSSRLAIMAVKRVKWKFKRRRKVVLKKTSTIKRKHDVEFVTEKV